MSMHQVIVLMACQHENSHTCGLVYLMVIGLKHDAQVTTLTLRLK